MTCIPKKVKFQGEGTRKDYERWRCPFSAVRRCDDEEFYRDIEGRAVIIVYREFVTSYH